MRTFIFANHVEDESPSAENSQVSSSADIWSRKKWLAAHPDMTERADDAEREARTKGYRVAD